MKKLALITSFTAMLTLSPLAYSMDELSDMDKTLKEMNLVDENMIYTDVSEVHKLFNIATQHVESDKDMYGIDNEDLSVRSIRLTPYLMSFDFQYHGELSEKEKSELRDSFLSEEEVKASCNEFYFEDKFVQANDVNTMLSVFDAEGIAVFNLVLNAETCE